MLNGLRLVVSDVRHRERHTQLVAFCTDSVGNWELMVVNCEPCARGHSCGRQPDIEYVAVDSSFGCSSDVLEIDCTIRVKFGVVVVHLQ